MRMEMIERFRGCLLGLAVGDALGTTLEFSRPGTFTPITDMIGGGPFRLRAGEWTDDTSMALCLATSLIEQGSFDPTDQMERYIRWYKEGYFSSIGTCFDIGNTTRSALHRFMGTNNPYSGSTNPDSAGNGSIMRLAPIPLYFVNLPFNAIVMAGESSRTTHGARTAIDACRYFSAIMVGALHGISKDQLLASRYSPVYGYWAAHPLVPEVDAIAAGSFKTKQPPEIKGSGYVVESLEAALWAFYQTDNYRDGCLLAANLGDDADTTAAVYGQLAGAFYGESAIPAGWRTLIAQHNTITNLAEQLYHQRPRTKRRALNGKPN